MTFRELLNLLRPQVKVNEQFNSTKKSEEFELRVLIKFFNGQTIQEWSKEELLAMFTANRYNLEAQIPCRHCGHSGKVDRDYRYFTPKNETIISAKK